MVRRGRTEGWNAGEWPSSGRGREAHVGHQARTARETGLKQGDRSSTDMSGELLSESRGSVKALGIPNSREVKYGKNFGNNNFTAMVRAEARL